MRLERLRQTPVHVPGHISTAVEAANSGSPASQKCRRKNHRGQQMFKPRINEGRESAFMPRGHRWA